MKTNQTIDGVPRALLERLHAEHVSIAGPGFWTAWKELRALLDAKPVEVTGDDVLRWMDEHAAAQPQGVPVAWRYKKSWEKIRWITCDKHPTDYGIDEDCYTIQPLYAEQPEPVAQKYDDTLLPFLALMRKELHANAGKGDRPGWLSMSADTCMLEIIYHFGKLQASVKRGDGDGMAEYGADVANLCMMLLDICGVINLVRHTEQPAPVAVGKEE